MKSIIHCLNIQWIWMLVQMWCNDETYVHGMLLLKHNIFSMSSITFPHTWIWFTASRCDLLGVRGQMFVFIWQFSFLLHLPVNDFWRQSDVWYIYVAACAGGLWGGEGGCQECVGSFDAAASRAEWAVPASQEHDWTASKGQALCNDNKARAMLVFGCWDSRAGVFGQWVSQSTV